jgi:hypothetical protein
MPNPATQRTPIALEQVWAFGIIARKHRQHAVNAEYRKLTVLPRQQLERLQQGKRILFGNVIRNHPSSTGRDRSGSSRTLC